MVLGSIFKVFLVIGALSAGALYYFCPHAFKDQLAPVLEDQYFGRQPVSKETGKFPKDDPKINKYVIRVPDAELEDLKRRLNSTRFVEPLEESKFHYGFHGDYLKQVVEYWRTKFDWRKQEQQLNKFDHYTTQIEGINVHFIHQKPDISKHKKVRVLPLLLVHGWPGSVVEFKKIIPLLTTPSNDRDFVFEVICPSIPGYGFSEAPHKTGFSVLSAARVFSKLMKRLGFEKYYVQGGDWGSIIVSAMGKTFSERVLGVHQNCASEKNDMVDNMKYLVAYIFPAMFTTPAELPKPFYITDYVYFALEEMGYAHLQATKPDTVAAALADSPTGLAAYLLEKFSTWTNPSYRDLEDGGLLKRFELDDLLTNVMVYWTTNTIGSSVRLYKETIKALNVIYPEITATPLLVPTGLAIFPHELITMPKALLPRSYRNVVRYTRMPEGGHFAALELPELLSEDIFNFIGDVEKMRNDQTNKN